MKFLITGATGFIGSHFIKYLLRKYDDISVIGVNRYSNQKNIKRLENALDDSRFTMYWADFSKDMITDAFKDIEYIFHFGAKTFVDYSIQNPVPFIQSNILGTYMILEEARKCETLKMYFQISTDEVYGAILQGSYREDAPLNPSNPYSATKSAGDMLSIAYHNTYNLPIIITRTENVYGSYQSKEKVFPTFVRKALNDEMLPVYGDGHHSRQWLYVEDKCSALINILEHGKVGEIYHIAGYQELENLELAKRVLKILNKTDDMIKFIPDEKIRPGHDRRYALSNEKICALGWMPKYSLDEGIKLTVEWYKKNQWWSM